MARFRTGIAAAALLLIAVSVATTVLALAWTSADKVETSFTMRSAANKLVRRIMQKGKSSRADGSACRDLDGHCAEWARSGECQMNPGFMNTTCRESCSLCGRRASSSVGGAIWSAIAGDPKFKGCDDQSSYCGQWAAVGECVSNPNYMRHNCPVTCHLCQSSKCHDLDTPTCAEEVAKGMCRKEPDRMYKECRWSCKWCAMDTSSRCLRPKTSRPAARKGTLAHMFGRALSPELAQYSPIVHSRDPWVVSFETFLSADEADRIIQVGGRGWRRSLAGDGVQAVRTSSTSWCEHRGCGRDPLLARVRERIANVTLVPETNAEHLQVLKYDVGQFYKVHHDQNSPQTSAWGPRMYTFFMYLNDAAEGGGGETHFPQLNISIKPKRGRALLWPSVLNEDPNERDFRTEHEAVVVRKGQKFAANYWLHMYDFQDATDKGCGNTEVFGNWPDNPTAGRH